MDNVQMLVNSLRATTDEKSWLEFKHNNYDPQMIGRDIAALANAAALAERNCAYMIWGVNDKTHDVVGTQYDLQSLKRGNQEIENWLRFLLSKNADFSYELTDMNDAEGNAVKVGVLTIAPACNTPVMFERIEYIRVGSYTKKLNEFPQLQARLWDKLRGKDYETQTAKSGCTPQDLMQHLHVSAYYDSLGKPMPLNRASVLYDLSQDELITKDDNGLYDITNLGALLLAKQLSSFRHLERKAVRVIRHKGCDRLEMLKEQTFDAGYAISFERIENFLNALLPTEEQIGSDGIRRTTSIFPSLALREALSNMCIHQDLTAKGTSLLVEIFDNRIEITNPGTLLVDVERIVDTPPRSRNEKLAALMRRFHICEEAGTGWDKMVQDCERMCLPAPRIIKYDEYTKVVIMSKLSFSSWQMEDKLWALYLHASLGYLQGHYMSNSTLRSRFGLDDTKMSSVSRLIKEALKRNLIKPLRPDAPPKLMQYVPSWS